MNSKLFKTILSVTLALTIASGGLLFGFAAEEEADAVPAGEAVEILADGEETVNPEPRDESEEDEALSGGVDIPAQGGAYVSKVRLSTSRGIEPLRKEFTLHNGTQVDGRSNDYALYSPVGKNDTNKYPVIIFIHGLMHGFTYGGQLEDSFMPYWASSELQSRFKEKGAFIMLPRSSNNGKFAFWGNGQIKSLKAAIDDVIANNRANVDTDKIIIMGSSAGGGMTRKMLKTYPDFFGGAVMLCQTGLMTAGQVQKLGNMPIWTVATKNDLLVNYWLFQLPIWNTVKNNTSVPDKCRHTVFSSVRYPDGSTPLVSHNLCQVISYDFQMLDGSDYPNCTTVDGNGNPVRLSAGNGIIEWINSFGEPFIN